MVNSTILDLIVNFIKYHQTLGHSDETIKAYRNECEFLFNLLEKEILKKKKYKITDIRPIDIQNLIQYLKFEKKNKNISIARKISCLNSFFTYLEKFEIITLNIMKKIDTPKIKIKVTRIPTDKHKDAFFNCLINRKYKNDFQKTAFLLFFYLKYGTMARTVEMVRIKVKDIDYEERIMILRGKGNKERVVPLTKKGCLLALKFRKIAELKPNDRLIRNKDNKPISKRGLELREKKIREEAKLPKWITLHPLFRKKPATVLFKARKDLTEVQDLLGHTDPKTTRIYVKTLMAQTLNEFKKVHPLENE